jgi:hypothetical protein
LGQRKRVFVLAPVTGQPEALLPGLITVLSTHDLELRSQVAGINYRLNDHKLASMS